MTGISIRVALIFMVLVASQTATHAQRVPAFDPERILMLSDADLDGRLSFDEYRDQILASPRMRNGAAMIEPMFRRLDTDRDGFLSLTEYRGAFIRRPGGGALGLMRQRKS